MDFEKLTSKWINGDFSTFSLQSIEYIDLVMMATCINGDKTRGPWKDMQARYVNCDDGTVRAFDDAFYSETTFKNEFKSKLEDPILRFEQVDVDDHAS